MGLAIFFVNFAYSTAKERKKERKISGFRINNLKFNKDFRTC